MKAKLQLISLLFFGNAMFAQTGADLDINNIKARLNAGGDLFWDFQSAKFEAPKGTGINPIFAANLWIAGYDNLVQLKVAGQTYRQTGNDYWPGPLDTGIVECPVATSTSVQWNRVWKINKTTIDSFKLGLFQTIPQIILDWPGNGTAQQTHILAPFHDMNSDGNYSPSNGDYPIIKGDQAVYFIYNDNLQGSTHTETGGQHLGVEVHAMAYAYKCTSDSALDNTIFINYKIHNRSFYQHTLSHIGFWTDFDIGLYSDDFVGSDVARQCYYGYNGTAIDGNGSPGTYGDRLGAEAVVFLKGIEADSGDGIDNNKNCIVDEPNETTLMSKFQFYNNDATSIGNPSLPFDYYNYMSGRWKDNSSITYGGNGHNTGPPCDYMFPGNSDQIYGWGLGGDCTTPITSIPWDETNSGNTPSDRRGIGSSGPFTMNPGGVYTLDLAFVFGRDYTASGIQQSLNVMNERVDSIRSYFDNNSTPCGGNFSTAIVANHSEINSFSVYPNPASEILNIIFTAQTKNAACEVFDVTGKIVVSIANEKLIEGKIDISSLSSGLYLMRIVDGDKVYSQKFLKE